MSNNTQTWINSLKYCLDNSSTLIAIDSSDYPATLAKVLRFFASSENYMVFFIISLNFKFLD